MVFEERTKIEDIREMACNSLNALCDICLPKFDEEMKEAEKQDIKDIEELKDNSKREGKFKEIVFDEDKFKEEKIIIKRKLFRAISCFLDRKSYMKGEKRGGGE